MQVISHDKDASIDNATLSLKSIVYGNKQQSNRVINQIGNISSTLDGISDIVTRINNSVTNIGQAAKILIDICLGIAEAEGIDLGDDYECNDTVEA